MNNTDRAHTRLVETGGRISQDLGMGRIVGQVLVYLYLEPTPCALEELEKSLGLSKASVSIAARQLEGLGLVSRVWIKGDRRRYYRSADNIASAMQLGVLSQIRQKVAYFGEEIDACLLLLNKETKENLSKKNSFLVNRIGRAKNLQMRLNQILENPLIKILERLQL